MRSYKTKLSSMIFTDDRLVTFFKGNVFMTVEGSCWHEDGSFKLSNLSVSFDENIDGNGCLTVSTLQGRRFVEVFDPMAFKASVHADTDVVIEGISHFTGKDARIVVSFNEVALESTLIIKDFVTDIKRRRCL